MSRFDSEIRHPEGLDIEPPPHKVPIIGFSATFSRHDKIALGLIFERVVYHRDFIDMIDEQWYLHTQTFSKVILLTRYIRLCDIRFTVVKADLKLDAVPISSVTKDFKPSALAKAMIASNDLVVRSWIDQACEGLSTNRHSHFHSYLLFVLADRKSTLVFCVNVDHVVQMSETFRRYGIDARYLVARTPPTERQELVRVFKNGEFPVLVNCCRLSSKYCADLYSCRIAVLTEGADIPNIDCILLTRPTRSRNLFAQMACIILFCLFGVIYIE